MITSPRLARRHGVAPAIELRRRLPAFAITGATLVALYGLTRRAVAGDTLLVLLLVVAGGGITMFRKPQLGVPLLVGLGVTIFSVPFRRLSIAGIESDVPELLAFGLIGGWIARTLLADERLRGPYVGPVLLAVAAAVVGTAVAGLHGVSRADLQGGIKPYLMYLVALVLAGVYRTDHLQRRLQGVVLWLCSAGSVWVLFRAATGGQVASESDTRLATLGQVFDASRYRPPLLNLLPLGLLLVVGHIVLRGWSMLRAAQVAAFTLTIVLGYNRSSWLPIALAALLAPTLIRGPRRRFAALRLAVAVAVIAPGLYVAAHAGVFGSTGRAVVVRVASTINPNVLRERSYQDRAAEDKDAIQAISRSPVLGVGVAGLYGARRPIYRPDLARYVWVDRPFVHNSYLFAWLQLGLLGLLAIGWLAARIARTAARARVELPPEQAARVLAASLALLAYGLSAFFQPFLFHRPTITAVCLALALAQPPDNPVDAPGPPDSTSSPPLVDLPALLGFVRRRWAPLVLCLVVGVVGALSVTKSTPKAYASTARLFVTIPAARGVGEALQGVQLSSQLLASYSRIATSDRTAELAAARLEGQFSAEEIQSKVSAAPAPETLLIDVRAEDLDPITASVIANATADALSAVIKSLEETSGVEARVIDAASTDPTPVRPRPRVDLTLGAMLGLAVGVGLALLLESLDRSITTSDQAGRAFGAPSLAVLPRDRRLADEPLVAFEGPTSRSGEGYRALRTAIRFIDGDRQLRRILVASAGASEGRTTVAANLAIAFAQSGERVMLIDADLRRPRLSGLFGAEDLSGLTDVILGKAALADVLQPWRGTLEYLPHGALPSNPSEMLGSEAMARLLDDAAQRADIVIIDAPPVLPVADATLLAAQVDGVVQVARWGSTNVGDGEAARQTLDSVNAHVIGVALNAVRRGRRSS